MFISQQSIRDTDLPPGPHIRFKNLVHSTIFSVKFLKLCELQPGGYYERTSQEFYVIIEVLYY